jgi:cytoskeletal protein CcmA (bactofilin family)
MALWNEPREGSRPANPRAGAEPAASPSTAPPGEGKPGATTPAPVAAGQSGGPQVVLGVGAEFEGKVLFDGAVRIDGKVKGAIRTGDLLIVGETAEITAEITCGSVIVHGTVTGDIHASNSVELSKVARMRGNVETPSLVVARGAVFEGQTKMGVSKPSGPA